MPPGPYANFWTMNSSCRGTKREAPPLRCLDRPLEGLPEAGLAPILKSPAEGKNRFLTLGTSPRSGESLLPFPGSLLDNVHFSGSRDVQELLGTQEVARELTGFSPTSYFHFLFLIRGHYVCLYICYAYVFVCTYVYMCAHMQIGK